MTRFVFVTGGVVSSLGKGIAAASLGAILEARGLKIAARIRKDGVLSDFVKKRYSSFDDGIGKKIESGSVGFADLEKYALQKGEAAANQSGRQEMLENIINDYL